jgi:hypothetical protein
MSLLLKKITPKIDEIKKSEIKSILGGLRGLASAEKGTVCEKGDPAYGGAGGASSCACACKPPPR